MRAINNAVIGEVGAQPLFAIAMERTVRFVRAVEQVEETALVKVAMETQKKLQQAGKQYRYTGYTRLQKQTGGTKQERGEIKKKLQKTHKNKWEQEIKEASRLKFYT